MRFLHELVTVLEGDVRKGPGITDGQQPLGDREGGRTILLSQETCLCKGADCAEGAVRFRHE